MAAKMLISTAPGKIPGYTANNSSNGATTFRDIPDTQAGGNEPMDPKKSISLIRRLFLPRHK
jgi:hypothetical protein